MATATERIPVLVTKTEKSNIIKKAKRAGLSTGEYMRQAAKRFQTAEDNDMLENMIEQMLGATNKAERSIDEAIAYVEASNQRIAIMEAKGPRQNRGKLPDGDH